METILPLRRQKNASIHAWNMKPKGVTNGVYKITYEVAYKVRKQLAI